MNLYIFHVLEGWDTGHTRVIVARDKAQAEAIYRGLFPDEEIAYSCLEQRAAEGLILNVHGYDAAWVTVEGARE